MDEELTIEALVEESHATALDKGWYDPPKTFTECVALFHSEISEALEEHRNGHGYNEVYWKISEESNTGYAGAVMSDHQLHALSPQLMNHLIETGQAKPEGIPIELADLLIRVADTCGYYKIDLTDALYLKMQYNTTRPFRHGEKVV